MSPSGGIHKRYLCVCDCGNQKIILKEHLTSGRQKSCGCLRRENGEFKHGEVHTRLYKIWGNTCNRCSNINNPAWKNYGGRGIYVCKSWNEYLNFKKWAMSNGYSDALTLDRIDNNMGYSPENCRWVNRNVQANNKRNNRVIYYNGQEKTLSEWSAIYNIPYKALYRRIIDLHWDVETAFTKSIRSSHQNTKQKK